MLSIDVLKITLHSAAAEKITKNYITFLDPGGINYVIIVGPTVDVCKNVPGILVVSRCTLEGCPLEAVRIFREVLHGVGADGVGVKFPLFCSKFCCCLPLSL